LSRSVHPPLYAGYAPQDEGVSVGLIALLDDVAAIAKAAASSLDDVAGQAVKAGAKSAGVVIDDAAVTPRYVLGLSPAREIPIVAKIARGSLRNKLVVLLPIALALSTFASWGIVPLLMLGGAYLCYEGAEKVVEALFAHAAHVHHLDGRGEAIDPVALEEQTVSGAIRTDFILSAEIMAIALAAIPSTSSIWMQATVLAIVGIAITALVYGGVALIVKADDVGLAVARNRSQGVFGRLGRLFGRGLVHAMPGFLTLLSGVGTAAMIWVGGGIILHGLEAFGLGAIPHAVHRVAHTTGAETSVLPGAVEWLVGALGAGLLGLAVGLALIPVSAWVLGPLWRGIVKFSPTTRKS
jgi:predicted DNA repair protein MutK